MPDPDEVLISPIINIRGDMSAKEFLGNIQAWREAMASGQAIIIEQRPNTAPARSVAARTVEQY